jgi:hemolysin III
MTAKASPVAYVGSVTTLDATTAPGIRPDSTVERAIAATKPHLRGWLHAGVTPLVLAAGIVLICLSPTPVARLAASIYALSGFLLFATSALFHRGNWSPVADRRFNRIDHANIYLIIAGSYTPVALLGLPSPTRETLLTFVWVGALAGIAFRMLWMGAPRMLYTALYIALGWSVAPVIGQLFATRIAAAVLTVVGGGLYTLGGVVFGFKWPGPSAVWFGYHEVFHLATVAAWTCQYIAISMLTYR